jgi:type I restriction enzyme S subunit
MNSERLLAHYASIADAPDAVARLRCFILDLAVRGKLVPQNPEDEPASELLKRIAAVECSSRRHHQWPEIDRSEVLDDLPSGWSAAPLIALGSWAIGAGFPKSEQGLSKGSHLFLKVSDMNLPRNDKYITTSNNFIDDEAAGRMGAKIHPPGTIIFPKIGGAIATNKRRILTKGSAIDNNCLGITFSKELDIEWAYLLLTTLDFSRYQAGTAVPALQQSVLGRIAVGLPPLAEQRRIVAKVNELMALCEQLRDARAKREAVRDQLTAASFARLNAADPDALRDAARFALSALPVLSARPDQIKQLRQIILHLAILGKIVHQDSNDEPAHASVALVRSEAEIAIRDGVIKRRSVVGLVDDSELLNLPHGWRWSQLGEVTRPVPYAIKRGPFGSAIRKDMFVPKGFKIYEQQHAISGDFSKGTYYISEERFEQLSAFELHPNEILVSCSGTVGRVAIVPPMIERGIINQALLKLSLHQSAILNEYFLILFPAFFMRTDTLSNLQGTAQKNIPGVDVLREMPFPLPPIAEQHRIVTKVDELMTLCHRLEASLAAGDDTRRRLLNALLAEVLTPAGAVIPGEPARVAAYG